MKGLICLVLMLAFAVPALSGNANSPCGRKEDECEHNQLAESVADLLGPGEYAFVSDGQNHHTRAVAVAALELLWDRATKNPHATPDVCAVVAVELIEAYLDAGLSQDAIALFESLDKNVQVRVTEGPVVYQHASGRNLKHSYMGLMLEATRHMLRTRKMLA